MNDMSPSTGLVRRHEIDLASMPPPPIKRIKRPPTVLDEDVYTDALADIIARDYFPGLAEAKAQEEYLEALASKNESWIKEAGQSLLQASAPATSASTRRTARDTRFDTPRSWTSRTPAPDTPHGATGSVTPYSEYPSTERPEEVNSAAIDTSNLSLTTFQGKCTSEDNESFNAVLDKQNLKRRQKHAYLWTPDQRILSTRLIKQRADETKFLEDKQDLQITPAKEWRELIPLTVGATASRSAKPDSWQQTNPANNFMFAPDSVNEQGIPTIMEAKEAASKAGPKETVFRNTRFPPPFMLENPTSIPASPSLNTSIIKHRDAARLNRADSDTTSLPEFGGATPRVNGYAFVDEDEPEPEPGPSYRDLLSGHVTDGDSTPNPFTIHHRSAREDLHHRLVEKDSMAKRKRDKDTARSSSFTPSRRGGAQTPGITMGNMTPAAKRLMEKMGGRTPSRGGESAGGLSGLQAGGREMWTPGATPRTKGKV